MSDQNRSWHATLRAPDTKICHPPGLSQRRADVLDMSPQAINEDKETKHSRPVGKVLVLLADRDFFFRRGAVVGEIQPNKPDQYGSSLLS